MKTSRLNTGIYELEAEGKTFEVELDEHGIWVLFEMVGAEVGGREYMQDFCTLRDAKAAAEKYVGE